MKEGDVLYWFKCTLNGELKWYKIKYIRGTGVVDASKIEILKRLYDNTDSTIAKGNVYSLPISEIFSMKDLLWRKNTLFKTIFTVGLRKQ